MPPGFDDKKEKDDESGSGSELGKSIGTRGNSADRTGKRCCSLSFSLNSF